MKQIGNDFENKKYYNYLYSNNIFFHLAGSLWATRIFYILFQRHIPRNASGAWHRRLFFVKRAFGNPHKSIGR